LERCDKVREGIKSDVEFRKKMTDELVECNKKTNEIAARFKQFDKNGAAHSMMQTLSKEIADMSIRRDEMYENLKIVEGEYGVSGKYLITCLSDIKMLARLKREQLDMIEPIKSLLDVIIFTFNIPLTLLSQSDGRDLHRMRKICKGCVLTSRSIAPAVTEYSNKVIEWKEKSRAAVTN